MNHMLETCGTNDISKEADKDILSFTKPTNTTPLQCDDALG